MYYTYSATKKNNYKFAANSIDVPYKSLVIANCIAFLLQVQENTNIYIITRDLVCCSFFM